MNIDRLFHVLVLSGASSTVGLAGCGNSTTPMADGGTGGTSATGGSTGKSGSSSDAAAGASATGGSTSPGNEEAGADGSTCSAVCKPDKQVATWIDCNGCCCWLPAGATSPASTPICGEEPCCAGRGR